MSKKLTEARVAKKDEFYTRAEDIEAELKHYDFKDMRVLMSADDPVHSQFWKYFKDNFEELGLKEIIATHYNFGKESNYFRYNGKEVTSGELVDGDFRSEEVIALTKESDIVITNPPFSLFGEMITLLDKHGKKFLLVGNQNAITQKKVFELLKERKMWLGRGFPGCVGYFRSPYEDYASGEKREGLIRVSGVYWYTNMPLDDGRKPLELTETYCPKKHKEYDNYNAINIDRVVKIPKDYYGKIGVPITFMNKYNSNQFEIIGLDTELIGSRFKLEDKTKYARIVVKKRKLEGNKLEQQ